MRKAIRFLVNDTLIERSDVTSGETLLDFLRLNRGLTGSKEGCAEGDCGACTVLVGRLSQGELKYETVNSCIRFVGSLDACHVVTIEYLKSDDGVLHPVQRAMVERHGSQCGFCTPGIVMSLYALWLGNPAPAAEDVETALQGNLCRCTGYKPIFDAAIAASEQAKAQDDRLIRNRDAVKQKLLELALDRPVEISMGDDRVIVPEGVDDLADTLQRHPEGRIVAGSTDVGLWVTKHLADISPVIFINHLSELQKIEELSSGLQIGACVSYTDAISAITMHFPQMKDYWFRIGGEQVRNMGTIGGNIANGSPIGDTPPPLIALGAKLTLRKGRERRTIPLEDFFIEYGKQDRHSGEFVEGIDVPFLATNTRFEVYKISKRRDEDISALTGAFLIELDGERISSARLVFGGMAGVPKRATAAETALKGQTLDQSTINAAKQAMQSDFEPLTDMRATADYRAQVAANLLERFYLEHTGTAAQLNRRGKAA
ncbi:MAG: xanthine dehydrogenase small subunit [Pseudomonadota bacterium]